MQVTQDDKMTCKQKENGGHFINIITTVKLAEYKYKYKYK